MARSDEAEWWFNAVYGAIQGSKNQSLHQAGIYSNTFLEIPYGKVSTYGHIARLLGRRE